MRFLIISASAGLLALSSIAGASASQKVMAKENGTMFTMDDFRRLSFLEGRWSGKAPDGTVFYEEYDFPDKSTMRSRRHADASFAEATDGSTVALKDGRIISTWGDFTWEALRIDEGEATFRPVNAPSTFSWRRLHPNAVEVTQNWKDEKGMARTYSLTLNRIR